MSVKLLVAEDHHAVRQGLQLLLHSTEFRIVAETASRTQTLGAVREFQPDVVLCDVRLGRCSGFDVLRQLRAEHPHLPVLMHSTYDNRNYIDRSVLLGAQGYAVKGRDGLALIHALRQISRGEAMWSREDLLHAWAAEPLAVQQSRWTVGRGAHLPSATEQVSGRS